MCTLAGAWRRLKRYRVVVISSGHAAYCDCCTRRETRARRRIQTDFRNERRWCGALGREQFFGNRSEAHKSFERSRISSAAGPGLADNIICSICTRLARTDLFPTHRKTCTAIRRPLHAL